MSAEDDRPEHAPLDASHADGGAANQRDPRLSITRWSPSPSGPDENDLEQTTSATRPHSASAAPVESKPLAASDAEDYHLLQAESDTGVTTVFRARQRSIPRDAHVFIAGSEGGADQRLSTQACLLGSLHHTNIVPVYELGHTADGATFVASRRPTGLGWHRRIEPPLAATDRDTAIDTLIQVCETMQFVHARGVLHLDLKPAHVVIGDFGEVIVTGWHDIRAADDPNHRPSGTPAFMAPEQARGEEVDTRTDVYLLGGMLFWLLTGRPPHPGDEANAAMHNADAGILDVSDDELIDDLGTIARRALAPDAAARHASVTDLHDDLQAWRSQREGRLLLTRAEVLRDQPQPGMRAEERLRRSLYLLQDLAQRWPDLPGVSASISRTRLAYGEQALRDANIESGLDLLDVHDPQEAPLVQRLRRLRASHRNARRTARWLARTGVAALLIALVVGGTFGWQALQAWEVSSTASHQARQRQIEAEAARQRERRALATARHQRHAADLGLIRSNIENGLVHQASALINGAMEPYGDSWPLRRLRYRAVRHTMGVPTTHVSHAFWTDGRSVIALKDNPVVAQWDLATGEELASWRCAIEYPHWIARDGETLIIAGANGAQVFRGDTATVHLQAHESRITAGALAPNGDFAITGDHGGEVIVWRVADGTVLQRAHFANKDVRSSFVEAVGLDTDTAVVAVNDRVYTAPLQDLNRQEQIAHHFNCIFGDLHIGEQWMLLCGYGNGATGPRFLNSDGGARWFNIHQGFHAHTISPDGTWIAAAAWHSRDLSARPVTDGSVPTLRFRFPAPLHDAVITPDNRTIIGGYEYGWMAFPLEPFHPSLRVDVGAISAWAPSQEGLLVRTDSGTMRVGSDGSVSESDATMNQWRQPSNASTVSVGNDYAIHVSGTHRLMIHHAGLPLTLLERLSSPILGIDYDAEQDRLLAWTDGGLTILPTHAARTGSTEASP